MWWQDSVSLAGRHMTRIIKIGTWGSVSGKNHDISRRRRTFLTPRLCRSFYKPPNHNHLAASFPLENALAFAPLLSSTGLSRAMSVDEGNSAWTARPPVLEPFSHWPCKWGRPQWPLLLIVEILHRLICIIVYVLYYQNFFFWYVRSI